MDWIHVTHESGKDWYGPHSCDSGERDRWYGWIHVTKERGIDIIPSSCIQSEHFPIS
jgi:hypothetical protein